MGCSGVDVSAATALLDSTVGVTDFTLTAALTPSSGNFSETLYNFTPNVASANLTIATGGPAGVTLASTLPGQPVEATFVDSGNAFVNVVVGLDTNISTYCVLLRVTDVTAGGGGVFSQPICAADYNTGAISLPSTTDTYMITVTPQGDAVGNITIGVGAQ